VVTHAMHQDAAARPPCGLNEPTRPRDEVAQRVITVVPDIRQVKPGISCRTSVLTFRSPARRHTHTLIHPSRAAAQSVLLMGPYIGSQSGAQLIKLSPTLTTCVMPMALSIPALPACSLPVSLRPSLDCFLLRFQLTNCPGTDTAGSAKGSRRSGDHRTIPSHRAQRATRHSPHPSTYPLRHLPSSSSG